MKRTRLRPVSQKRQKQNALYRQVKADYMKSKGRCCEFCRRAPATDIHHKAGRTGNLLCAVEYFAAVCRPCHDWIHANPKEATERGYIIRLRDRYIA